MKLENAIHINHIGGKLGDGMFIPEITRDDANSILFSAILDQICFLQSGSVAAEELKISLDFILEAYRELSENT